MVFRDALNKGPVKEIEVRTNASNELPYKDDMLFGYCSWDGEKLISLDGDFYDLGEEIYRFEYDGDGLTVWIVSNWSDPV